MFFVFQSVGLETNLKTFGLNTKTRLYILCIFKKLFLVCQVWSIPWGLIAIILKKDVMISKQLPLLCVRQSNRLLLIWKTQLNYYEIQHLKIRKVFLLYQIILVDRIHSIFFLRAWLQINLIFVSLLAFMLSEVFTAVIVQAHYHYGKLVHCDRNSVNA